VSDLLDIRDAAEDVATGVAAAIAGIESALTTGTVTAGRLGNLRASLRGHRAEIAAIRGDLDALDVTDYQLYPDAAVTLALWGWERELRHSLVAVAPSVRQAEKIAVRLVSGSARKTVTARAGETLQSIAARELGDWRDWVRLADANGLAPGALVAGTQVVIPGKR